MAKAVVQLGREGYRTEIRLRDHVIYADEPVDAGGTDTAPTPMEMMLGALGACMAVTTRMYAQRKRWPLEGVDVALDIERFAGKDYAAYTGDANFVHEVRSQIKFYGPLDAEQRERLLEIAGKCPVHRAIENPAFFVDQMLAEEEPLTLAE
jgi:putative redox protein